MSRYLRYLAAVLLLQIPAFLLAPLLVFFARMQNGWSGNATTHAVEPRLPAWLSIFQTPDNSLYGDYGWQTEHCPNRWQCASGMVGWLWRNRLFGLYWGRFAAQITEPVHVVGEPVDKRIGKAGLLTATSGKYWEYKRVTRLFGNLYLTLHFGWLLHPCASGAPEWYEGRARMMAAIKFGKGLQ